MLLLTEHYMSNTLGNNKEAYHGSVLHKAHLEDKSKLMVTDNCVLSSRDMIASIPQ